METWRNITLALPGHNRNGRVPIRNTRLALAGVAMLGMAILVGCASGPPLAKETPERKLTVSEPVGLLPLARTRVSSDRLPPRLVHQLCPEYALILIRRPEDWAEFCRRVELPSKLRGLSLEAGPVLGLLANVGEKADDKWPIRFVSVQMTDAAGSLNATVLPGLYYPLKTAGYLELAQLRGADSINTVRINSRTFTLSARGRLD